MGALYKELKDGKDKLRSEVGIDLDAVTGNINIKTMRQEFDDMSEDVVKQAASIDLLNSETEAKINLIASRYNYLEGVETGHYAELVILANDLESAIELKADRVSVQALSINLNSLVTTLDGVENQLDEAKIDISAMSRRVDANGTEIANNKASISSLSNSTQASISAVVSSVSSLGTKTAYLELKASSLESSIEAQATRINLKADTTTLNSRVTTINGEIANINADITNVRKLIADEIRALKIDTTWLNSTLANIKVGVYAPIIRAGSIMTIGGKDVATKDYVELAVSMMATKNWVTDQKYLTTLPSSIVATSISATSSLSVNSQLVATQAWVTAQITARLSSLSIPWYSVTGKPSTFPPSSHNHSFSGSSTFTWGHMHSTASGNTGGVVNYANKTISISGSTSYN
jgi:hypothetical protein